MKHDKMKREEAMALLNFVEERLRKLDPEPKFFGKAKWQQSMLQFEYDFLKTLEEGENNFYGAIWQFFETSGSIFLGETGMRELAEHTTKEDGKWIYRKTNEEARVIYA